MTENTTIELNNTGEERTDTGQIVSEEEQTYTHETETALAHPVPARVYTEGTLSLQVIVSCALGCDLRGGSVEIVDGDTVLEHIEITSFDEAGNSTDEFTLQIPKEPGEYTWTAVYSANEEEEILHESSSVTFSFTAKSHVIGLSSWDMPFPVVQGSDFKVKVGAGCSGGCRLAGELIEVYDQQGTQIAASILGEEPWQGTAALYWTELELRAPDEEGFHKWELRFPKPSVEPQHVETALPFTFRTAKAPEHEVTVEVIHYREKTPVKKAAIMIHSNGTTYRGYSDSTGVAKVSVPKGEYSLSVTAHDYKLWQKTIEVSDDLSVDVDLIYRPD